MNNKVLSDYRKKSAYSILVALLTFAIVTVAAVNELPHSVEDDLRIEIQSMIASLNTDNLTVLIDGQDVTISGNIEDEKNIAIMRESLRRNDRIRLFELQLEVENPDTENLFTENTPIGNSSPEASMQTLEAPATIEPDLTMLRIGKRLMISGNLPPSELFDATVEDLASALQINNTLLQSNDVKKPIWLETIIPVITTLPMISGANLELKESQLILNGSVDSQSTLDAINARIADVDESMLAIHSNFWVVKPDSPIDHDAPLEDPNIEINWSDGRLQLSGTLSSDAALSKVRNVLLENYKPSLTENALQASDGVNEASWLDELIEILPGLQALETAQVTVAQGKLTLSGESGNAEMPIKTNMQQYEEPLKVNNEIVMLDVEPESTSLQLRKELDNIALDQILFQSSQAIVSEESFQVLEDLAQTLKRYPDTPVIVAGHTDSTGSEQTNQTLSQARANAVRDELISKGVNKNRVSAVGYGESQPVESNETPEARALNRRIEINY